MDRHSGPVVERTSDSGDIEWVCPQCEQGSMVSNGERYLTAIPLYFHQCDRCGYAVTLSGVRYPRSVSDTPMTIENFLLDSSDDL